MSEANFIVAIGDVRRCEPSEMAYKMGQGDALFAEAWLPMNYVTQQRKTGDGSHPTKTGTQTQKGTDKKTTEKTNV